MQRGFARHQDQSTAFFEHHIGGACDQIIGDSAGDLGQGLHRAGGNHHAACPEGTRRNRCTDVGDVVQDVGHLFDFANFKIGLVGDGTLCRLRENQMSLDRRVFEQL